MKIGVGRGFQGRGAGGRERHQAEYPWGGERLIFLFFSGLSVFNRSRTPSPTCLGHVLTFPRPQTRKRKSETSAKIRRSIAQIRAFLSEELQRPSHFKQERCCNTPAICICIAILSLPLSQYSSHLYFMTVGKLNHGGT